MYWEIESWEIHIRGPPCCCFFGVARVARSLFFCWARVRKRTGKIAGCGCGGGGGEKAVSVSEIPLDSLSFPEFFFFLPVLDERGGAEETRLTRIWLERRGKGEKEEGRDGQKMATKLCSSISDIVLHTHCSSLTAG